MLCGCNTEYRSLSVHMDLPCILHPVYSFLRVKDIWQIKYHREIEVSSDSNVDRLQDSTRKFTGSQNLHTTFYLLCIVHDRRLRRFDCDFGLHMKTQRNHDGLARKVQHFFVHHDLFESVIIEGSCFGGFATFILLPLLVGIYLAAMYKNVYLGEFTSSQTLPQKNCTRIQFVCTSPYGCELGPAGPVSKAAFSNHSNYVVLNEGEEAAEWLCPGVDEGLDFARRSSLQLEEDVTKSKVGFAVGEYGYFGSATGWVQKVNLLSMKLVDKASLTNRRLVFGFAWNGFGFFMSYYSPKENVRKATIFKIDLTSLSIVTSYTFEGYRFWCGCVYNDFAFLGTLGTGYILKLNLKTLTFIRSRDRIAGSTGQRNRLFACNIGDNGIGYFGSESGKLFEINLTSTKPERLESSPSKPITKARITSIAPNGYQVGDTSGATWYNQYGKSRDQEGRSVYILGYVFGSEITFLGYHFVRGEKMLVVATEMEGLKQRLGGRNNNINTYHNYGDAIRSSFIHEGFMYAQSYLGRLFKISLDKFDFAGAGEPVGKIKNDGYMEPFNFPLPKVFRQYSTFYKTDTLIQNRRESGPHLKRSGLQFWSNNVLDFNANECSTGQPQDLCYRANLAEIRTVDTTEPSYTFSVAISIVCSGLSAIYSGLKIAMQLAQKYEKSKRCRACRSCRVFQADHDEAIKQLQAEDAMVVEIQQTNKRLSGLYQPLI